MTFIIAVLKGNRMLSCPAISKYFFYPVCLLRIVVINSIALAKSFHVVTGQFLIFDPIFCTENFRGLAKSLVDSLERVRYFRTTIGAITGLCCNKNNTITGLSSINCC